MTTVGKILVFLNLVFSLVVGAFAMLTFTARTHWAHKYEDLKKSYTVLSASARTYESEANRLTGEREDLNKRLYEYGRKDLQLNPKNKDDEVKQETARAARAAIDLLKERDKQIVELQEKNNTVTRKLEALERSVVGYKAGTKIAQEDVKSRQADVEKLRDTLRLEVKRNNDLVRDINDYRDRAVAAEITSKSLRERNNSLEEQLQDLARDLARIRSAPSSGGGGTGIARRAGNPPPDDVEGLVRRAEGNLVTLSIGSDAGLTKGQTLEVFRFGAAPRYIGRIKIVDVEAHQAVGQVVGRVSTAIKVGDTAASSIMRRR